MLDSARRLFVSQGYADTTMARIATDASVAVQTLYYTFQTKGKLLIEVVEVASAGGAASPVPVPQREWFREMMSATNAQRILALLVEGSQIYERVAPLWPAVAEAISDPDVARWWEGVATGRRNAQRGLVVRLADLGALRPGLDLERATDVLFLLGGHGPYRSLVEEAGWPVVEYRSWLFTTLVHQLLGTTAIEPEAVADVSFGGRGPRQVRGVCAPEEPASSDE
jgi:AcrR family transcriptional regulator